MLIELLSTSNYVSFNSKLAEMLGLHAAIYVSEVMNINEKALRKSKVKDDFFVLDREYLEKRTTIKKSEQLDIEENLCKLGVMARGETQEALCLNISMLATLMMGVDDELIDKAKKLKKKKTPSKLSKEEQIRENLYKNISTTNEELLSAYKSWIDSVILKHGCISATCVQVAQREIDKASGRNLDVALQILEIAAVNCYRDIQWAINKYNAEFKVSYKAVRSSAKTVKTETQLSSEVF